MPKLKKAPKNAQKNALHPPPSRVLTESMVGPPVHAGAVARVLHPKRQAGHQEGLA